MITWSRGRAFVVCAGLLVILVFAPSCSVRKYAIKQVGDALSKGSSTFASDNDPELIRAAVPFSLKLIEALLEQSPKDPNLLYAAATGFTQYSYGFVHLDAERLQSRDADGAAELRERATKLYVRARDYGMRALELRQPNLAKDLKANPKSAVARLGVKDVPLMYWTAVSWAGALAASRDIFMLPQIAQIEALTLRALELDESYDEGALHTFMIAFEMGSPTRRGDKAGRAKEHFDRALALSKGRDAGVYVAYAESVLIPANKAAEAKGILEKALAIDVDAEPQHRLVNLLMQRRARMLLGRVTGSQAPGDIKSK